MWASWISWTWRRPKAFLNQLTASWLSTFERAQPTARESPTWPTAEQRWMSKPSQDGKPHLTSPQNHEWHKSLICFGVIDHGRLASVDWLFNQLAQRSNHCSASVWLLGSYLIWISVSLSVKSVHLFCKSLKIMCKISVCPSLDR